MRAPPHRRKPPARRARHPWGWARRRTARRDRSRGRSARARRAPTATATPRGKRGRRRPTRATASPGLCESNLHATGPSADPILRGRAARRVVRCDPRHAIRSDQCLPRITRARPYAHNTLFTAAQTRGHATAGPSNTRRCWLTWGHPLAQTLQACAWVRAYRSPSGYQTSRARSGWPGPC